jgi:hypothetical protein
MIQHLFDIHVCLLADVTLDQLIDYVRSVEPYEPEVMETEACDASIVPVGQP